MIIKSTRISFKFSASNIKYISSVTSKNCLNTQNTFKSKLKPWSEIPGPSTLPFVGQLHHFFPGGSLYNYEGYGLWKQLYDTYGPIVRLESILKPTTLILYDPECIAKVLHAENWTPSRPAFFSLKYFRKEYNRTKEESCRSAGLAVEDGEMWRDMRTKVNPVLMMPDVANMYSKVIDEVALDTVARIKEQRDIKNMILETFDKELNMWSLESIGVVALGCRINCFDSSLNQNSTAKTLIRCSQELFDVAHKLDFQPSIWKYYATPTFKKAMAVYTDLENATKKYINMAIYDMQTKKHQKDTEKSVLEKLLEIDSHVAHVMATDMLIAGIDTTTITALSALYNLAKNPKKQQKLREEVALRKRGPYLKACLKESLRLMPTVGLNYRVTTKEYDILGYKVPKGIGIIFCHHVLGLMDEQFPKSNEFIPERWIVPKDHQLHYKKAHPFVYLPFGFGVRTCIGRRIAELELETLLTRLVENFEVDWTGPPPEIMFSHLNYVKGPYYFVFNDVKK